MAHKLIILFTVLSTLVFLAPPSHSGKKPSAGRMGPVVFGDIQLSTGEGSDKGTYLLEFTRRGVTLFRGECAFKIHESRIVTGMPFAHCRSLLAYCFSGGAHCCMTAVIATDCGSQICLGAIDLAHSDQEVLIVNEDHHTGKKIKVTDWQFAYYSLEDSEFLLSFADSPGMTRLLLFDNGQWRADHVGEFSRFYSRLFKETLHAARQAARKGSDNEVVSAIAIRAAYYTIMAGTPIDEATAMLKQLLPPRWTHEAPRIMADIRRAVSEFNPVEKIL